MRVVSWNLNSLRARLPRVLELLEVHDPDLVCMQETKCTSEAFPRDALAAVGYQVVEHCEGRWNGVALLVRASEGVSEVVAGLDGEPDPGEARWVEATVRGLRVVSLYVPNGRDPGHEMFRRKLAFLDAAHDRIRELTATGPLLVAGDWNVAPTDVDVWDPGFFVSSTHVTEEERSRVRRILQLGLQDAYRELHPEDAGFTWWDYRMGAFHRGMGLRIDLALVSGGLAVRSCTVDTTFRRNNRAGDKPSDHAPLVIDIDLEPPVPVGEAGGAAERKGDR